MTDSRTQPRMDALVYTGAGQMAVERLLRPVPGNGEVLVEVARCGICGTDVHLVLEQYARPGSVLGHEWVGRIAALGAGVDRWRKGDRVTAGPAPGCGNCRACSAGRPSVCRHRGPTDYLSFRGAFAEYVIADAGQLVRIPDAVDDRSAALTEPLAVALHAVTLGAPGPEDRVLVTGAGPLGLLVVAALATRGVTRVAVSEPSPLRREQAGRVGATTLMEPGDLPEPPMGEPVERPYDVVFECSGSAAAAETALDQLDRAGTLVLLGTGSERPRLNHNRMIVLELTVIGAYNYDASGFEAALELLASERFPGGELVEPHDVALDGVLGAIEACAEGRSRGKVLVDPSAPPKEDST